MEGDAGSHSPVSTASTAVDLQSNGDLYNTSPPPKSPNRDDDDSRASSSLPLPRRRRNSIQRRSFSSANKLPILQPSSSLFRRRFDLLLLWVLQTLAGLYFSVVASKRFVVNAMWGLWYDWHAWPWCGRTMIQRDIAGFEKMPRHLAVILDQKRSAREYDADEMVRRAVDVATWCACVGISIITVYEPTGLLKKDISKIQRTVLKNTATFLQRTVPLRIDVRTPQSALLTNGTTAENRDMEILVVSQEDSRWPIIDLARTLGDMTKQEKLFAEEISIDLVHENLTGTPALLQLLTLSEMLMTEPDLLILFTPRVDLQGFPPWQIRLTEIFHLPDNSNFGYSVFIRALREYNKAEMRLGR